MQTLYALLFALTGSQGLDALREMPDEARGAYLDHAADVALAFDRPELAERILCITSDEDAAECLRLAMA